MYLHGYRLSHAIRPGSQCFFVFFLLTEPPRSVLWLNVYVCVCVFFFKFINLLVYGADLQYCVLRIELHIITPLDSNYCAFYCW